MPLATLAALMDHSLLHRVTHADSQVEVAYELPRLVRQFVQQQHIGARRIKFA